MKLVLPTGPDGADREYPADSIVWDATMSECVALLAATGMSQDYLLEQLRRVASGDAPRVTEDADLMRAHMGLVWLTRYRAGERGEDGEPLTLDGACDFPLRRLRWKIDPGDPKPETEDPPVPSQDSGRATGGGGRGAARKSATHGKRS